MSLTIAEIQELLNKDWVWNIAKTYLSSKAIFRSYQLSLDNFKVMDNNFFIKKDTVMYALISDKGTYSDLQQFIRMLVYIKKLNMEYLEKSKPTIVDSDDSDDDDDDDNTTAFGNISVDYIHTQYLLDKIKNQNPAITANSGATLDYYKLIGEKLLKNKEVYVVKIFYGTSHYIKMFYSDSHYYQDVKMKLVNDNNPFPEWLEVDKDKKDYKLLRSFSNAIIYARTSNNVTIEELHRSLNL